jgi:hypothetical protein
MLEHFLILALLFQVKHLIADYYLQFPYMYENKGKDQGWIEPLFDHVTIHAAGTLIIIFSYFVIQNIPSKIGPEMAVLWTMGLVVFDFITHFITDRWKATQKTDPSQSWFWQSLGIDQMIHHSVGIIIIYIAITL